MVELAAVSRSVKRRSFSREAERRVLPLEIVSWVQPVRRAYQDWIEASSQKTVAQEKASKVTEVDELEHIRQEIEASRELLELRDNWDGEGAAGYSPATLERATELVDRYARKLWKNFGCIIDAPKILPGPDGSIDILWKSARREMLINIPSNAEEPASFYGDDFGNATIKGTFDPRAYNLGLLCWFVEGP